MTTIQLGNLRTAAQEAAKCEVATGIPCELMVAQWAVESGWGANSPGNNAFGIKSYTGASGRQLLSTTEYFNQEELQQFLRMGEGRTALQIGDKASRGGRRSYVCKDFFATFLTLGDCFQKRADLFGKGPYKPSHDRYLADKDILGLVRGVARIYATAPNYADVLISILSREEVMSAIGLARAQVQGVA